MKHGGTITALSLVLAFAHHVRLCAPFSSVAPWQSSHPHPSQGGTHRSAWALEAATTSETIARREDMLQAKRAAKDKLVAQRIRTLQQLLPGLDAYMLVYKSPRLLTSAHLSKIVPARLAAMERLLPGVDVQRLVKLNPDLLLYDVEKTLAPRIMHLKRLFPESPKLLMRAPALLLHDTETFLIPKIEELGSLLPGIDVLRVVRREPTILYLDIARTVKQRLKSLAELLPGQNVTAMVGKVPRLLTSDVSGMAQKLSSLRWLLGPDADLKKIVHRKPDLLLSNVETTVAAKFRELQHLFPEGDVVSMVERDATVLFYDFEKSINVKVDCWRERVSNVTELDQMITAYPVLLSYSLDTTVSRLDFLIQTNGTQMNASKLRQVSQTPRRDWDAAHGDKYRKFLERKVEGPSVLRLWPGLYFDSDTFNDGDGRGSSSSSAKGPNRRNRVEGEGVAVRMQDDGSVLTTTPSAAALKAATAHVKSLERQYGSNIKETQLRFSSALRRGKHGASPTEMDMILYDIKSFDQQVRKLAMGTRIKRFRELLPGLNEDKLFKDFPQVVMMDLKKVEERVQELRGLLCGSDLSSAVSIAPNLLLNDVQTCLRPRMTRLVVALTAKQLEGVLDADKVKGMVVRCPQLLLSDVRNVVVPSLQYMLRSTSDHSELAKRIFRDPSLLVVGVGPLARLQYTLEQYRDGTASVSLGRLDTALPPPPPPPSSPLAVTLTDQVDTTNIVDTSATATARAIADTGGVAKADAGSVMGGEKGKRRRSSVKKSGRVGVQSAAAGGEAGEGEGEVRAVGEDQSRLLPPVVVPQILKCQLQDFVDRNPGYVSFLAQRQGLPLPLPSPGLAGGDGGAEGVQAEEAFDGGSQVVFWERAVGARLSQAFRPVDSPYALEKKKEAGGKGPAGQKGAQLSELDLLVGDVLYFNHRMGVLASKIQIKMPPTVDLRQEATKLAEDVQWGSRQIRRLLGLGSWTEREVAGPPSESTSSTSSPAETCKEGDRQPPLPPSAETPTPEIATAPESLARATPKKRRKKRQWVSDTFQSFWEYAGGNGADLGVHTAVQAVVEGGGGRETAAELERLLGEVSGYEGRLEGLLDLPINADADDTLPSEDGVETEPATQVDPYASSNGQLGG